MCVGGVPKRVCEEVCVTMSPGAIGPSVMADRG